MEKRSSSSDKINLVPCPKCKKRPVVCDFCLENGVPARMVTLTKSLTYIFGDSEPPDTEPEH